MREDDDPIPMTEGDLAASSPNAFVNLYCFRDVLRDVAIVSIVCFWVEDEYSSFPDPEKAFHKLVKK